ncbi:MULTISPECIES: sensor domain-containing diguanylate cyclase [Syntrophotalea]|jgi:diguanylate cyclase (GGDEF)-like protein|uniref:diguanylate cyclase n=2 Tax=Syntrophotalea acetylenica TaxID=29542 RepID=A0A1L3GCK9_SYNAC|nr:GGDEF domain-containing protein [Syntrophotalea acetylenica]APG23676.1 hypothetical protein A7E75_00540 [Syntrophotalea acetylenica]
MEFTAHENLSANDTLKSMEQIVQLRLELPTPPNVVFRLLEVVRDDEHSFREIGAIISKDPSLTARMMKAANSSVFGFPGKIRSIDSALTVLGINLIRNIALSFVIVEGITCPPARWFDITYFWKRAITSAVAAEMIASLTGLHSDDTFLCSLLQDIGVLVMYQQMEDDYKQVLLMKAFAGSQSFPVERELIGFDHGQLGGLMLKQWGLPESVYLPVFHHHDRPPGAFPDAALIGILRVGDMLSALYHGAAGSRTLELVFDILESSYGLEREAIKQMIDLLAARTMEILNFFDIDPGEMKPLSQLLQEANAELGKRAMSYECLVGQLRQSREESTRFIAKLLEANNELRNLAYRDELTGLYNHRYFLQQIDKELERSSRYGSPLSLMFFDIDFFKDINDSHGHLAGDAVLRSIASQVTTCMRGCDVVARYGGDEFAVIMPETDRGGLESLCERLRGHIERTQISVNGKTLGITVSIGGACFDGQGQKVTRFAMLNVADQAIYQSKKSGRNTITVRTIV